jgi:hypothetical protein
MVLLWSLLIGILAGLVRRGSLLKLGNLPLKALWLVFAGLIVQFLVFPTPWNEPPIQENVELFHYLSYALLALFFVVNWKVKALWIMAFGMVLNAVVILANEGFMPADVDALACAGETVEGLTNPNTIPPYTHANVVRMSDDTQLNFLGDWICIPAWVPFANAISLGDVVLMIGLAWLVQSGMVRKDELFNDERPA